MTLGQRATCLRSAALASVVLLVVACSTTTTTTTPSRDSAPAIPPVDLSQLPDPVPRVEPPSRYGNKSPYEVLGKTYYVLPNPERYKEYGNASWYGTKFHGRPTSSGEPYDMYKLTAAHRSLPIPCFVRVTNLNNQRTAIVRVNDRGPFHNERVIDLSYAAAVKLGFANQGTARVMIELVDGTDAVPQVATTDAESLPAPEREEAPMPSTSARIFLQAGAFNDAAGAERLRRDLTDVVGDDVHVQHRPADRLYRVRIGPVALMSEATRLQALIVAAAFAKPLIVRE